MDSIVIQALLLKVPIHIATKTVDSILQSWNMMEGSLLWDHQLDVIPGSLSIHQLLSLMSRDDPFQEWQVNSIIAYCRVRQIYRVVDL